MFDARSLLLYLCADPSLCAGRPIDEAVEAALRGGATAVQLRCKGIPAKDFYEAALILRALARRFGAAMVVNDRADIAAAVGADGLHIGQADIPLEAARRVVGAGVFIGVSARTPEAAVAARDGGADYLGCGPVFPTSSKEGLADAVIGVEGLREIRRAVDIPVVGIGGIGPSNAAEAIGAGASGVAVISSVLSRPDIEAAAAELRRRVEQAIRGL
ncbi:MAG: thiamine phosphate synthase [Clostridiales Family XIII bacterium]|jgi:thiamine-phosphate pyrophosphorylase|nr:thiamine phosphate synthase [Clostridiales Family XIII bacterium]